MSVVFSGYVGVSGTLSIVEIVELLDSFSFNERHDDLTIVFSLETPAQCVKWHGTWSQAFEWIQSATAEASKRIPSAEFTLCWGNETDASTSNYEAWKGGEIVDTEGANG